MVGHGRLDGRTSRSRSRFIVAGVAAAECKGVSFRRGPKGFFFFFIIIMGRKKCVLIIITISRNDGIHCLEFSDVQVESSIFGHAPGNTPRQERIYIYLYRVQRTSRLMIGI